jgi:hypothetical protein
MRPRGRPFPKGVSGNPGGRPKELRDVVELARSHSPDAIKTLASVMQDEEAPPAARVAAANALLDRGYRKPAQAVAVGTVGLDDISRMTDEELEACIAARLPLAITADNERG